MEKFVVADREDIPLCDHFVTDHGRYTISSAAARLVHMDFARLADKWVLGLSQPSLRHLIFVDNTIHKRGPVCDHGHAQIEFSQRLRKSLLNASDNHVSPQLSQLARVCFGEDIRFVSGCYRLGMVVSSQGSDCFYYPLSTL